MRCDFHSTALQSIKDGQLDMAREQLELAAACYKQAGRGDKADVVKDLERQISKAEEREQERKQGQGEMQLAEAALVRMKMRSTRMHARARAHTHTHLARRCGAGEGEEQA